MKCSEARTNIALEMFKGLPRFKELSQRELLCLHARMMRAMNARQALALPALVAKSGQRARARVTHPGKRR